MEKTLLFKKAFVSALGVAVYVMLFAWTVNHGQNWFGTQPDWLDMSLVLVLFIISACITGSLVLLRPITMYMSGQKENALRLFGYTVLSLVIIAIVAGLIFVVSK